jgi:hypothetical protein
MLLGSLLSKKWIPVNGKRVLQAIWMLTYSPRSVEDAMLLSRYNNRVLDNFRYRNIASSQKSKPITLLLAEFLTTSATVLVNHAMHNTARRLVVLTVPTTTPQTTQKNFGNYL